MVTVIADYTPILSTHEETALGAAAVLLTVDPQADAVILQALGGSILLTIDGTTPDAGAAPVVGFRLLANNPPLRIPYGGGTILKVQREADGAILQKVDVRTNA